MKLETLSIRGVLAFGELVTLDLRDLPPLVAVIGSNGQGKTTTLEAPLGALYRQLPSRPDRPLVDYATRGDAFLEVTFELEGRGLHRARLSLDGPHRSSQAILARVLPDGQEVLLNDGKLTTYDTAVAELLPSYGVLLASVFAAQNRAGSFVRLDRRGRKALFSTLLGLDRYDELAERAKAAAGFVSQALERLQAQAFALARDADPALASAFQEEASRLQRDAFDVVARRTTLAADQAVVEARLAAVQLEAQRHGEARVRADRSAADLVARRAERDRTVQAGERAEADSTRQRQRLDDSARAELHTLELKMASRTALDTELEGIDRREAAAIADTEKRLANNRHLLDDADAIRRAVQRVAEIDARVTTTRTVFEEAERARRQAAADVHGVALRRADLDRSDAERAAAERSAATLQVVPCGGVGPLAACQFLKDATVAAAALPELQRVAASRPALDQELAAAQQRVSELDASIAESRHAIDALIAERATALPLAGREAHLKEAEARIAELDRSRTATIADAVQQRDEARRREIGRQGELEGELAQLRVRILADRAAHAQRVADAQVAQAATLAHLDQAIADLELEHAEASDTLSALQGAKAEADAATAELQVLRRAWDQTTATRTGIEHQRAALMQRQAAYEARRAELVDVEAQTAARQADLVDWQLLQKAFGRDGDSLQVLEIDSAGPTVAAFTNDLLHTCFGSRFTVDLVTQEAKRTAGKDGSTMKDAFELKVFDSERGGDARDLSDLSGGEQVLVDEALKSAIALLVNTRNVHPIRTCWRDETTGALDAENADRYLRMLRRVQELGQFAHLLFITHNADAALQADAQIVVANGQLRVELPPYGVRDVAA